MSKNQDREWARAFLDEWKRPYFGDDQHDALAPILRASDAAGPRPTSHEDASYEYDWRWWMLYAGLITFATVSTFIIALVGGPVLAAFTGGVMYVLGAAWGAMREPDPRRNAADSIDKETP